MQPDTILFIPHKPIATFEKANHSGNTVHEKELMGVRTQAAAAQVR